MNQRITVDPENTRVMTTYTQKFDATVNAFSRSEYAKKLDPNKVWPPISDKTWFSSGKKRLTARKVAGRNIAEIRVIVIIDRVSLVDCSVSRFISPFSLIPCSVNLCISWLICLPASFDLRSCIPWTCTWKFSNVVVRVQTIAHKLADSGRPCNERFHPGQTRLLSVYVSV